MSYGRPKLSWRRRRAVMRAGRLVRLLRRAPATTENVSYNRRLWEGYAAGWDDPKERRRWWPGDMVTEASFEVLGEEWGHPTEVTEIVAEYIYPLVSPESIVGEIGCGGGRLALQVADRVHELYCFDVAPNMLRRAQEAFGDGGDNVRFVLVDGTRLPVDPNAFDFLYSFDVFVHLDLHTQWKYIQEIAMTLKPNGHAFIHTANLTTDQGWNKFSNQDHYEVTGFYFVTPQTIRTLISRAGLRIIKQSTPNGANGYLDSDLLVIMQKPA